MKTIRAAKTQSVGDRAYHALLNAILRMELKPGDSISEASIAQQLEVSRTPVREAIKRLEQEGLISVVPRQGSIVSPLDHEEIADGCEIRAYIECRCLERGFRIGLSGADIERLRALEYRLKEAWKGKDLHLFIQADVEFHMGIVALGRSAWSTRLISLINMQLRRARYWTADRPRVESTLAEHKAIVEAIAAGDLGTAKERLRIHILRLPERVAGGRLAVDGAFLEPHRTKREGEE